MAFLPLCNVAKLSNSKDSPKFGKVIYNLDPKNRGRVKVSLDGIFEPTDETGSNLPWIRRMNDTFLNGNDTEAYSAPAVGAMVEIIWPYDNETAYYRGVPYGKDSDTGNFTSPSQWGWADSSGFVFRIDKADNHFVLKTAGFTLQANSDGSFSLSNGSGSISMTSGGDITLKGNNITLDGSNISIKGSSAVGVNSSAVTIGTVTTIDGYKFTTHTHSDVTSGADSTGSVNA